MKNKPSPAASTVEQTTSQKSEQGPLASSSTSTVSVEVWKDRATSSAQDHVAQEVAVALVYNGISHVVMMASPIELDAFALGFSLSEGIISSRDEMYSCDIQTKEGGLEAALQIPNQCFARLKDRRRNLLGRTGCGICGAESLQQIRLPIKSVSADFSLSHQAIINATLAFEPHQPLQALTGAYHGAAWCDLDGNISYLCEDVGRHNALDKLIGKLSMADKLGQDMQGFLLMSSRASHEILQKAAMAGIGIVVAVSAPTSLAIDIAKQAGITLVGFSRAERHVCYANDWRLCSV